MKNLKFTLAIFFGGIFALWLLATSFPDQWGVYPVRNLMLQLTGAISILAMSACLILAVRPKILETPLGGLDKMYRLHKWFGIIALSGSILHWTSKQFPKWLVKLGLFDGKKPPRPPMQEILTLKDWLPPSSNVYPTAGLPNSTSWSSPFISRSCGTPSYW